MTYTSSTWNVQTIYATCKLEELQMEMERYKWHVLGISEMRWTGTGETILHSGDKLWQSGDKAMHSGRVGFLVEKETVPSVMECKPISSRIIFICVRAKPGNNTTVQMYAPTSSSSEDDIESFYKKLEDTLKNSNKRGHKILQGDWNCQIGGDAKRTWPETAGSFGVGMKNERGLLALHLY